VTDTTKSSPAGITLSSGTVQLAPYRLDFGREVEHRTSQPQSAALTNTGASVLSITGVAITGADPGDFSVTTNTCGSSVAAAASCTISVVFKPSTTGTRTANLSVTDSSTDSPQLVSMSGIGFTRGIGEGERVNFALASAGTVAVPFPTGPEPVGTRVLDLIDPSRQDPFLAGGAKRELLVRFWYPASLTQACKPADYASPRVWSYFSQLVGVPLPQVITNSCLNAPVADGLHPVVVFTHGYTGTFTDYTFIAEDLASRGYVIASVDHTYEATAVEFPDGRFVKSVLGSHLANTWRGDDATLSFAGSVRLQDLRFVLNHLERLNSRADDPFGGKLDVSRLAIAGHSAGGAIAFQALEGDARFKVAVILDGYLPTALVHPTHAPVLVVSARRELATPDHCTLWTNLHGPRLFVNLSGAEHLTPSDALWLAKGAIQTGPMGPDRTVAAIRDYVAAFLDTNLRDRSVHPLLTGPSSIYPDATVTTGDQPACSPNGRGLP
jgi:dienelactone hydrolase